MTLPPCLAAAQQHFAAFYGLKFAGRRLAWEHGLSRCAVAARFPKGRKELDVTLFQVPHAAFVSSLEFFFLSFFEHENVLFDLPEACRLFLFCSR